MALTNTMDGTQAPATDSRRLVAFVAACLVVAPLAAAGALFVSFGRSGAAVAAVAVLAVGAALATARLLGYARSLRESNERSLRLERAMSTSSSALLKRGVADPVGTALLSLVDGVEARSVFLDSIGDKEPDQVGTITTVRDVLRRTPEGEPAGWDLIPWRVAESTRKALESGEACEIRLEATDRRTEAMYRASQIFSEVVFPITVEDSWVGNVGFSCSDPDRVWTEEEKQLLRVGAEMIGVYWERRDAIGRLEELVASKDEFIASVSHEVRTPLTAVLGFAHELHEANGKFTEQEQADLIELLADQSQEVANIVDDLLVAARAETGTIVVVPQSLSIRTAVGEVLASHSGRVDFSMAAESDVDVWADPVRLRQVLRNLLTNADRYGGGIVKVHVVEAGEVVRLEVRDNGEGVPESMREHVFEPYARGPNGSTQPASVGLGLAVARKLAQLMEGDLELSRQDGWTVFTLSLPVAAKTEEAETAPRRARQPITAA